MKRVHTPIALALLVAFPCLPALAAEAESVLAPVKTSAAKDLPVQEKTDLGTFNEYTPMSGSTISREEIEEIKFVDPRRELLWRIPGMTMIRNIRIPDGSKSYTDKRVDGMRVNTYSTGNFNALDESSPSDIERVEVITGPGSVLSSSNAFGGTINVITRDPSPVTKSTISQELGAYDLYRTDFAQGGTLDNGLGYFFNLNYMDNKGWRDDASASEKKGAASGKVVMRPDDFSKLTFRFEYLNDISRAPGSITEAQFNQNWRQPLPTQYSKTDVTYVTPSVQYKRRIGEKGEFNISFLNRHTESTSYSATSASAKSISEADTMENSFQTMYRQDMDFALSSLYVGLDTTWMDAKSMKFSSTTTYAQTLQGIFAKGALTSNTLGSEQHNSPFIHYEFSPINRLRLSLGVRYDNIELTTDNRLGTAGDGSKSYSKLVSKAGASYELGDGHLLWARAAEGFLAPSVSDLLGTGGTPNKTNYVPMNMDLKPIESTTYEIGLRGTFPTQRLRYDVAYFDTDLTNMMVRENCGATENCYQKNLTAGRANLHGLETSLTYGLTNWLDIGLAHTYSKVKYLDYKTQSGSQTIDYSGNTWKGAPTQHLNLRLAVRPAEGWRGELEMDLISSYFRNNENVGGTYSRPDLFHLRVSYAAKTWTGWVHVLNLFDTKYAERAWMTSAGAATYDEGYKPLTLRAGVSYRF